MKGMGPALSEHLLLPLRVEVLVARVKVTHILLSCTTTRRR